MAERERKVFTLNEWSIYTASYLRDGVNGAVTVYAHHQGCTETTINVHHIKDPVNCWHTGDLKPKCILCNAQVPECIQALVMLYQWER